LHCGACDILRLYEDARAADRKPEWNELPEQLRKNLPFGPSPIVCHGCRSDAVFAGCKHCPMRSCARKKGLRGFCQDCESYPCLRLRVFGAVAWLLKLEKRLPHQQSKRANLERVRCVGAEAWLREQAAQWRCPDCGEPYSWYRRTCAKCGTQLPAYEARWSNAAGAPR
jgi:predicted RNA-binding Zn-ribbon protein involved in translation (DUF1610 family)